LVSAPTGFERHDDAVWDWLRDELGADTDTLDATVDGVAPYRGLAAFTTADADMFFGRERAVEALVNRLRVQSFVAVVGPSGAGKSSFVQAGVIPVLPDGWRAVTLRPGARPVDTLTARMVADAPLVVVVDQLEELFTMCA